MATATEISTKALKRLRVVAVDETPQAALVDSATDALTAMLASWEAQNLSGDVLPLDARFEQGVIAMLAVRIAGDYGKQPDAIIVRDATEAWQALIGAYFTVPQSRFDIGLARSGPLTMAGLLISSDTVVTYAAWAASFAYALRSYVINNANRYELITAGTSAASGGPTGTGSSIVDGTCAWCWRGATAA